MKSIILKALKSRKLQVKNSKHYNCKKYLITKQEVPVLARELALRLLIAYYSDYSPSIAAGVMPKTLQSIRAIFNVGSARPVT